MIQKISVPEFLVFHSLDLWEKEKKAKWKLVFRNRQIES